MKQMLCLSQHILQVSKCSARFYFTQYAFVIPFHKAPTQKSLWVMSEGEGWGEEGKID